MSMTYKVDDFGLDIPPNTDLNAWMQMRDEVIHAVERTYNSTPYLVGDYIVYGEDHWPEQYAQALDGSITEGTLARWVYIARNVPKDIRPLAKSSSHAYMVARLPKRSQEKMLKLASEHGWTARQLEAQVREQYPNPEEKRGRPKKERLTFEQWAEKYAQEKDIVINPAVLEAMNDAWDASRKYK